MIKALIFEDSDIDRIILRKELNSVEVDFCDPFNTDEVLEIAKTVDDYDVIIVDVMLTRMTGFEIVSLLSEKKNIPPIILYSGADVTLLREWSKVAEKVHTLVVKPLTKVKLETALSRANG